MAQMGRPGLSSEQKLELWRRWKDGQSLTAIGIVLGKHAGSIHGVLSANGGITPRNRTRRLQALTLAEREDISKCRIPDDCIDSKRYPLFMAREVMRQLIDNLCVTSAVQPGAL
jgi:hypothetical protein